MIKIIHENREQERELLIKAKKESGHLFLQKGKKYWLEIEVIDEIDAEIFC